MEVSDNDSLSFINRIDNYDSESSESDSESPMDSRWIKRHSYPPDEADGSALHSLEFESHGITVKNVIKSYLDHDLDTKLLSRETKKQKEKDCSIRLNKSMPLISNKREQLKYCSTQNSVEECSPNNITENNIVDSDSEKANKLEQRRKKRTLVITRLTERDNKCENTEIQSPKEAPNLKLKPFPQKCSSLKPVNSFHNNILAQAPNCPVERLQFYKTFSILIRMGSRERENTAQTSYSSLDFLETPHPQPECKHMLWLLIKAWHNGVSLQDEDKDIVDLRANIIPTIIDEVIYFKININSTGLRFLNKGKDSLSSSADTGYVSDIPFSYPQKVKTSDPRSFLRYPQTILQLVEALEKQLSDDKNQIHSPSIKSLPEPEECECNDNLSSICQHCINKETDALFQVSHILERVTEIEQLYPSTKALAGDFPQYCSPEFDTNFRTLNLWYNIVTELRRTINSLSKLFLIKNKKEVGWPVYDDQDLCFSGSSNNSGDDSGQPTPSSPHPRYLITSPGGGGGGGSQQTTPTSNNSHPLSMDNASKRLQNAREKFATSKTSSTYYRYVDKRLKNKGLKFIYSQISTILSPTLYRVHGALKRPKLSYAEAVSKASFDLPTSLKHSTHNHMQKEEYTEELTNYGVWSSQFNQMGLPTFFKPFFFLIHIPLDIVHECVQIRLAQQPENPSSLSIGQLIKECKEVLKAAIHIRQLYINNAQTIFGEGSNEVVDKHLVPFDENLKTLLETYLKYLETRISKMQNACNVILRQKNYLDEEWSFVRSTCPYIPGGEALVANKFCMMASTLLSSVNRCFYLSVLAFQNKQIEVYSSEGPAAYKSSVIYGLRSLRDSLVDITERARQSSTFAKTLRKDLEIAAEFKLLVAGDNFLTKLKETGHIQVLAPHSCCHMMFVPGHLQNNEMFIWQLLDMTFSQENPDPDQDIYLLMMRSKSRLLWHGPVIRLEPCPDTSITLTNIESDGLLLVVNHSAQLNMQSGKFLQVMGNTVDIDKPQTSCNQQIGIALNNLKEEALQLCETIHTTIEEIENTVIGKLPESFEDEADKQFIQARGKEVIHQAYKFGFEYQKAVNRLITGEARAKLGRGFINFACQWMKFVCVKCERGRGLRPRWANQGLEFLIIACDPEFLQTLSTDEFKDLKQGMSHCITHLIGSADKTASPTINPKGASILKSSSNMTHSTSTEELRYKENAFSGDLDHSYSVDGNSDQPMPRILHALEMLEKGKQEQLQAKKIIGKVSNMVVQQAPLQINARKVNFPWQKGIKIGEGRFGKVYTAVNNVSGELIALKEIKLQPNDHRAIREALDEIKIFEGIKHPNIVRYYGVEVHREELLIFMEFCNEGSLENAAQAHLPEGLIRKYTRQLLEAINVLHDHGIVHRDIKSANVFLTSDGQLKLGDFGCCIKLKNQSTMPGELCEFVGTPAYMAPEVFTRNRTGGHGRGADIWSVGCVVLEMLTGKRPWHDLEISYQIMFRVGMGECPNVPDTVNEEGQDFLSHCFQIDPKDRWSASRLLDHPFTKVNEDEEC